MSVSAKNVLKSMCVGTKIEVRLLYCHCLLFVARHEAISLAQRCGKSAIASPGQWDDGAIAELANLGAFRAQAIEADRGELRRCQNELTRQQQQRSATAGLSRARQLENGIKEKSRQLDELARQLGSRILALDARDERFSRFYVAQDQIQRRIKAARATVEELRSQRLELKQKLGFDVRALNGALFAALAAGLLLWAFLGSNGGVNNGHNDRTLVFIVPGTFGNADLWPNVIPGQSSFGSELQRAIGSEGQVYPFLWYGANDHPSRVAAAENLASIIDSKSSGFDRVCLVGHSHGGNIALRAAGLCRTKIDTVICLSTPHIYLAMRGTGGELLPVPVYCTWRSRQNITKIINIGPKDDSVRDSLANLSPGLDENAAIPMTQDWQEHLDFPRLIDDDFHSHFFSSDHLVAAGFLDVADINLVIQSFSSNPHGAIHSRRMGYIIGEVIHDAQSAELHSYILSLVQPQDEDFGDPLDARAWQSRCQTRASLLQHVGWRLDKIAVHLLPEAKQIADNADGTAPAPFIQIMSKDDSTQYWRTVDSAPAFDATWSTRLILYDGQTDILSVYADHLIKAPTCLGRYYVSASQQPPTVIPANSAQGVYWSADLSWISVHY